MAVRVTLTCRKCGNTFQVPPFKARKKSVKYCSVACRRSVTKHGGAGTRLYNIWCGLKTRCNNSEATAFERYGGRGIGVCDEWADSFAAFRAWAVANGYQDNLSIDRIDGDKWYSPDNCRWANKAGQARNRSKFPGSASSQFKGVSWHRASNSWQARIAVNSRSKYLGVFATEESAARAYDAAAVEHFGDFAKLNFPQLAEGVTP